MKTRVNFRSVVFQRAYRLVKQTGCAFADALRIAWNRYREYKTRIVADLISRINLFNYSYQYIDDGSQWKRWDNEKNAIRENLLTVPASFIPEIASQLRKADYLKTFVKL